jgi:hypothetical protein
MAGKARVWTFDTVRRLCAVEDGDDGCWIWGASVHATTGKPVASIGGKPTIVGRWMLEQMGRKTSGAYLATKCEYPRCCNPKHLTTRTRGQCVKDSYASGTRSKASEYPARLRAAQSSGTAKLKIEEVEQIRRMVADGQKKVDIARQFGIHVSSVFNITSGKRWKTAAQNNSVFTWRPAA